MSASPEWAELSPADTELLAGASRWTMTSAERLASLVLAARYISNNRISGDVVECGVWRGGSSIVLAHALSACHDSAAREFWMFDTFGGMTPPSLEDGPKADERYRAARKSDDGGSDWCRATLEDVRGNVARSGLPDDFFHYVVGDVTKTLTQSGLPERIAILRLDTDFYDSTLAELQALYPRLSSGGVLIVDDYGHWDGARRAVDEYFLTCENQPFLIPIDYTGRVAIKP